jgi:hypothetical protein
MAVAAGVYRTRGLCFFLFCIYVCMYREDGLSWFCSRIASMLLDEESTSEAGGGAGHCSTFLQEVVERQTQTQYV